MRLTETCEETRRATAPCARCRWHTCARTLVQRHVESDSGRVMVRSQEALTIRTVSHDEVEGDSTIQVVARVPVGGDGTEVGLDDVLPGLGKANLVEVDVLWAWIE